MPALEIDGITVTVQEGATVLDAVRAAGGDAPTLCTLPGLEPEPACLVCVVRDEAAGRLFPSCAVRAAEGMRVNTRSPEASAARGRVLALLVAEHVGDCEAPCRRGCPLFIDVDRALGRLRAGDERGAAAVFLEHNPFPSVMGRLCHAPCEKVCRRARADEAVAVRLIERCLGDAASGLLPARAPATGKRVAVAGSGPAGLAAAYRLARLGHEVTVFEQERLAGGGFRAALAGDGAGLEALAREIDRLGALGVSLVTGIEAGADRPWAALADGHDALIVAVGEDTATAAGDLGLTTAAESVAVQRETFESSRPGVFAAGGAVKKTGQAVHAMRQGLEAAFAAHSFLAAGKAVPEKRPFDSHVRGLSPEELGVFQRSASGAPRIVRETGMSSLQAEAARCYQCACLKREGCALRDAVTAHSGERRVRLETRLPFIRIDTHPDVALEPGKCVKCGRCVRLCRKRGEPLGLVFLGRGFHMTVGVPFGRPLSEALTVATAEVVAACPTGALAWKRERSEA